MSITIENNTRQAMTEFCIREAFNGAGPERVEGYIAALTSIAHLCDQVGTEASRKADRERC